MNRARMFIAILILYVAGMTDNGLAKNKNRSLTIVDSGQPRATIVVSAENAAAVIDGDTNNVAAVKVAIAVKDLQEYIEKMSGAKLDVASEEDNPEGSLILVGKSKLTDAKRIDVPSGLTHERREEGFVIECKDDYLALAGNDSGPYHGTEYAVYEFLNRLGVRWYMPNEFGEIVPKRDTIIFPKVKVRETPDFVMRTWNGPGTHPGVPGNSRWKLRNKMNPAINGMFNTPGDGSVQFIVGTDEDFENHPEYFALGPDGERKRKVPNFSHPKSIEIAANIIKQYFRDHPGANSYGFGLADGPDFDESPDTLKRNRGFLKARGPVRGQLYDKSITEEWITYVNDVTEEVHKEFPGVYIGTHAYKNRIVPPHGVKPNDYMVMMFTPMGYCVLHAYDDERCWHKKREGQMLKRWCELLPNVWTYGYNYGMFQTALTPIPMVHKLRRNFPIMKEWGHMGIQEEGRGVWIEASIPSRYLRARLMWDVEIDVDQILDEFYPHWYGKAAGPMRAFYDALENGLDKAQVHCTGDRVLSEVYTPDLLARLERSVTKAEKRADTERTELHVHVDRLVYKHLKKYMDMRNAESACDFAAIPGIAQDMMDLRVQLHEIDPAFVGPNEDRWNHGVWYWGIMDRAHYFQTLADKTSGKTGELVAILPEEALFRTDPRDDGRFEGWYEVDVDEAKWETVKTTRPFYVQGDRSWRDHPYIGYVWYRFEVDLPDWVEGRQVMLQSPIGRPAAWCWMNGELVAYEPEGEYEKVASPREVNGKVEGSAARPATMILDVTEGIRPGKNQITLRVEIQYTNDPFYDAAHGHVLGGIMARLFMYAPK
jgi:hypothetical protein